MAFRSWYEFAVGLIVIIAILLLGEKGIAAFAILAFLPIILRVRKMKSDERETHIFYKGTQIVFTLLIVLIVISLVFADLQLSDLISVKKETWFLLLAGFLSINGLIRLFLLYKY